MTLSEWDKWIAPILHKLEDEARDLIKRTTSLVAIADLIPRRPVWPTKAEKELSHLIVQLEDLQTSIETAIDHVKEAERIYKSKPLEGESDKEANPCGSR